MPSQSIESPAALASPVGWASYCAWARAQRDERDEATPSREPEKQISASLAEAGHS
jgi:hypothetical protein